MIGSPDRLRAALAARYVIERELGQGGMATVYLGDCFSQALPVARGESLLFVGDDLSRTDVEASRWRVAETVSGPTPALDGRVDPTAA